MTDEEEFYEMLKNTGKNPSLLMMSKECARAMGMSEEVIAECLDESGVVWFDPRKYAK